ncbi:MAG: extracellular solute-binding protein [Lachnospiraceae bacterium]|nr:extracellular solute-binding protein [Lachnospiraceae bacterium]
MHMGKKLLTVSFAIIGMSAFMTGCGKFGGDHGLSAKDPQNIMIWNYYNGAQAVAFDNMIEEFNSTVGREKGIVVTDESTGSIDDLKDAINASQNRKVGAKKLPNIVQCYKDMATGLDNEELLVDLDDYVSEEEKATFVDTYIEDGKLGKEREWKLFPVAKSTEVMMINKQKWDAFSAGTGVELDDLSTWEGVASTAEAYYEWSGGDAFFGRDAFANYMLVGSEQLGHPIFTKNEDGTASVQLDRETIYKLWVNYYIPYIRGYYVHVGNYRTDDIKLGKIIASVNSTAGAAYFPTEVSYDEGVPSKIGCIVLPVPNFRGTEPYITQQGADMAVLKGTEREEYASVVFLKWFTEAERNLQFAVQTDYLPVRKAANTREAIQKQLEMTDTNLGKVGQEVLLNAVEELSTSHLCTTVEFDKSYEVRTIIENAMIDQAKMDYDKIQEKMIEGMDRDTGSEPYETKAYFEDWMKNLQHRLDAVLTEE